MSDIKKLYFKKTPFLIQNLAVSLITTHLYRIRQGGLYHYYRNYYAKWDAASKTELEAESQRRLRDFLNYAKNKSSWYSHRIPNDIDSSVVLQSIPILNKRDIIDNLELIKTIDQKEGIVNNTGGTTGNSMKTVYMKSDVQERIALLDHFRAQHGYKLGKKTAWFSGKHLISEKDISKGICSHYDFINKIRFYSTFHINQDNFDVYWDSLNKFKPEFIVGFPSSVYELCKIAESRGLSLSKQVKVFFPTAETVTLQHREVISRVLGCKLVNQYASSEGAPFILECDSGSLHIHPLTGVFEVVDENLNPSDEGEILVTSFATRGTPLIRYRIKDEIKLSPNDKTCSCGSVFPLVDYIKGRSNAFIYSPDKGKVNLNHFTVFTRELEGLLGFQIIQENTDSIIVKLVTNSNFSKKSEDQILSSLKDLLGDRLMIDLYHVDQLPREKSGKFQLVKNKLKLDDL